MSTPARDKKNTGERIQIRRDQPWGSVPESLVVDVELGPTARLVGIWLCIRPPNWIVRRAHLLSTLGIGLDSWWRARRELIARGYLVEHMCRDGGRFTSADLEFFPQPNLATAQGFTGHGKSEPGSIEPGKAEPLTETLKTLTKKPPPQTVVVVVASEIQWPAGLGEEQRQACWKAIEAANTGRRQDLIDELAGAMGNRPIASPAGWLRGLMKRELAGGVLLELAPGVAQARAARSAAAARETETTVLPAPRQQAPAASPTPAQLAGLLAARRQLASLKPAGVAPAVA
jgi:hypothetical protein